MSNKPVDSLKEYPVEIAIFARENERGRWHTADVSKTYKDGDEYKKTRNFGRNDLLKLNALVPQAIARMQELEQAQHQAPAQSIGQDMQAVKESAQEHLQNQEQSQDQGIDQ